MPAYVIRLFKLTTVKFVDTHVHYPAKATLKKCSFLYFVPLSSIKNL